MRVWVKAEVRDHNGRVIQRVQRRCRSYVRAIMDILRIQMASGAVNQEAIDTSGVTRYISSSSMSFGCDSGVGVTATGVRVGTSSQAVVISDAYLISPIAHGSGSGQLTHGSTSVNAPITIGSTRQFIISRVFTNNSGADITVNEVGIYVKAYDGSERYFCIERSLLTFTIPNGKSATVTYTIKVTV